MTELVDGGVQSLAASEIPRLCIENLTIRQGRDGPTVVDDVSFSVGTGEVLGLVGESGSGKTTIGLALLGYARRGLKIVEGAVRVDGLDLLSLGDRELESIRGKTVGYVPQDPASALNPVLRIGVQLREVLATHVEGGDDGEQRLINTLEAVQLQATADFLKRFPHQLSGGQQQRVCLAMAFLCRPKVIVLDEPTTGLDVSTQKRVLDTVKSLCGRFGTSAVYVSHDLAVVRSLATSVAVIYSGRLIEVGGTDEVFEYPGHPYTRGLLGAIPTVGRPSTLHGIEGTPPSPGARPRGCTFAPRCDFRVPECEQSMPPLSEVQGRLVRCLLAEQVLAMPSVRGTALAHHPSESETVLKVSNVCAFYGSKQVLFGVNADLPPRACLAVVGESGSGKTTLSRCIVGLHPKFTGDVLLSGAPMAPDLRRRDKEVLRRVQFIFQNPYNALNPRKSVEQILDQPLAELVGGSRVERRNKCYEAMAAVALSKEHLGRFPHELSGGERQRVAIARALIVEPDVLVCDEVTSALDVSVQASVVELLRKLQVERELAILFITHNLALVRSLAQQVIVLSLGRVVESGEVGDVLERPVNSYTQRLIRDIPDLAAR